MPEEIVSRILRVPGYRVYRYEVEETAATLRLWVRASDPARPYTCGGCEAKVEAAAVHSWTERRLRDLPWGIWAVWLVVEVHRVRCPQCGVRTEALPFASGKAHCTARLEEAVARDCEAAPVTRVAARWQVAPATVRRMDHRVLARWAASRPRRPLRYLGVDEIYLGKRDKFLTVVSDLETGEPIWVGRERKRETLDRFFAEALPRARRRTIRAVCVDMWEPFTLSVREHLPAAVIVYDKFHVLRHAADAVDETRRAEFFRQGGAARGLLRGKRWLLLRSWTHLDRSQRRQLTALLALNRRLAKAHLLKEQLARLWTYTYRGPAMRFLLTWLAALRWQRLPAFTKVAMLLLRHLDGILAYCHEKVPFGKVEAINGNIRAMLRRGRGYRDHAYLLLKVQKATATRRSFRHTA
jgi:transposase